jgi:pimeloyl-ACP methyl ester carboxylesterase
MSDNTELRGSCLCGDAGIVAKSVGRSVGATGLLLSWLICGPAFSQVTCAELPSEDFSTVVDAPTQLTEVGLVDGPEAPPYCRMLGYVSRHVGFELRVPTESWNERLLFQGCGGFCGSLRQIEDCNDALERGYACVTTDLGHKSTSFDAKWAYNNRAAEIDFYYRATHVTTLAAKAIVERMMAKSPTRSYIRGCSTGGRQGLISAQRFPEDFDGVIAAAPAGVSSGGGLHLIWSALANKSADGTPILSEEDVDVWHRTVLEVCDGVDGVEDGIIADPEQCDLQPDTLVCDASNQGNCFSKQKIEVVKKMYSGARGLDSKPAYRAVPMPGSEPQWVPAYVRDDAPPIYYLFGGDFFRYLAFDQDPGPQWNPEDFDMARDLPRLRSMRMLNNAANPDLTAFAARGGKIVLYQGWGDESVPPLGIVEYLELATRTMGGEDKMREIMRLYMLPGVAHCRGRAV